MTSKNDNSWNSIPAESIKDEEGGGYILLQPCLLQRQGQAGGSIRVTAFRGLATNAARQLHERDKVKVVGRLRATARSITARQLLLIVTQEAEYEI